MPKTEIHGKAGRITSSKTTPLTVYRLHPLASGQMELERASQEWLDDYVRQRMRPLEVK